MTIISTRLTVDDLEGLPEGDGNRYELIEGELHVTTQPHMEHQIIADAILIQLFLWNRQTQQGGLTISAPGIIFAADEAMAPDVVWFSKERLAAHRNPDGKFYGPPDLAVEVLSKGTKNEKRDRQLKPARYAYWGVREYWLIDRFARQVTVYRPAEAAYVVAATLNSGDTLDSPMLPEFSCAVSELFVDISVPSESGVLPWQQFIPISRQAATNSRLTPSTIARWPLSCVSA
ncbi:Uma2 family endonuclease [Candidatus Gracilibacteria bacterium]|nr:Uma2 family endonuclease [Candidatus Gracilibacteria bacterium]